MKKILMHGAYILLIIFLIVLSQIKSNEAQKATILAKENAEKAEIAAAQARDAAAQALMERERAIEALKEAEEQRVRAEKLAENCK